MNELLWNVKQVSSVSYSPKMLFAEVFKYKETPVRVYCLGRFFFNQNSCITQYSAVTYNYKAGNSDIFSALWILIRLNMIRFISLAYCEYISTFCDKNHLQPGPYKIQPYPMQTSISCGCHEKYSSEDYTRYSLPFPLTTFRRCQYYISPKFPVSAQHKIHGTKIIGLPFK